MEEEEDRSSTHLSKFFISLTRAGDQLAKDLHADAERRENELLERTRKDRNALLNEVSRLVEKDTRVDQLERENSRLKRELAATIESSKTSAQAPTNMQHTRSSEIDPNVKDDGLGRVIPYQEYATLADKFNKLVKDKDVYKEAYYTIEKKYREIKVHLKTWKAYIQEHKQKSEGKRKLLPGTLISGDIFRPSTVGSMAPPPTLNLSSPPNLESTQQLVKQVWPEEKGRLSDKNIPRQSLDQVPNVALNEKATSPRTTVSMLSNQLEQFEDMQLPESPNFPPVTTTADIHQTAADSKNTSSQTTQDETQDQSNWTSSKPIHAPDDDDTPLVISSRSLKRKQRPSSREKAISSHKTPDLGQKIPSWYDNIKNEPLSSPFEAVKVPQTLFRTTTLDLDEIGQKTDTPRKRQRMEILRRTQQGSFRSNVMHSAHQERSFSEPPQVKDEFHTGRNVPDFSQGRSGNSSNMPLSEEPYVKTEGLNLTGARSTSEPKPLGLRRTSAEDNTSSNSCSNRALRLLSGNSRKLPRTSDGRSRQRRHGSRGAKAIPLVAEDGEERDDKLISPKVTAESTRRLNKLLEPPSPASTASPSTITPVHPKRIVKQLQLYEDYEPKNTPNKAFPTPTSMKHTSKASSKLSKQPRASNLQDRSSTEYVDEPLRSRPLHQLNLDDFKINPNANHGLDFAFSEVVRGRDARRCLPGCTKPECCGRAFRAMVEAGATPNLPRSLFSPSPPERESSQEAAEAEEHRLLKHHLGSVYTDKQIRSLPSEQRKEFLLDARVKLLADQVGRHRQAYQRRSTPPGFWRADFPSTQEERRDREEAERREREKVEKRWLEAMREGGRWLFRDE